MAGMYALRKSEDGQHYFTLAAENGETVLTSETYTTMAAARAGIASVRENGPRAERFERRRAKDGQEYFVLKAANGEVIGTSEMYRSAAAREKGIRAVARIAASAGEA